MLMAHLQDLEKPASVTSASVGGFSLDQDASVLVANKMSNGMRAFFIILHSLEDDVGVPMPIRLIIVDGLPLRPL